MNNEQLYNSRMSVYIMRQVRRGLRLCRSKKVDMANTVNMVRCLLTGLAIQTKCTARLVSVVEDDGAARITIELPDKTVEIYV